MSISANSRCASTAFHCAGGMSMGAATGARKVQVPQPSSSNARPRRSLAALEQMMMGFMLGLRGLDEFLRDVKKKKVIMIIVTGDR